MPQPIVPIHQQQNMPVLFGESSQPEFQLSDLQVALLNATASSPRPKMVNSNTVKALVDIDKNTPDLVVTAITGSDEAFRTVPSSVDNDTLLGLKADGLVSGYGRSVKLTDRGRTALKNHYLNDTNSLDESKTSSKFDYQAARSKKIGEE